jgi:hypothetical protein
VEKSLTGQAFVFELVDGEGATFAWIAHTKDSTDLDFNEERQTNTSTSNSLTGYEYVIVGKWRHNPILGILQRLPLQRLPFSSAYHSPAPSILQRLPFSSDYLSSASSTTQSNYFAHFLSPDTSFHACSQTPSLAITFLWHFSSQPGGQWLRRPEIPNLEVNGYDD